MAQPFPDQYLHRQASGLVYSPEYRAAVTPLAELKADDLVIPWEVRMALFGDLSKEALPAKKIAANLSRLLPDFSTDSATIGERPFIDRQENHMRRAVEAADIIAIALACNGGRIASKDLPLLLSNPILAKASTLFLTTKESLGAEPIDVDGHLHPHFSELINELTQCYGQHDVDLENSLKREYIEWRDVAALVRAGVDSHLISEDDVPYALSDGSVLRYLVKALQLLRILKGDST